MASLRESLSDLSSIFYRPTISRRSAVIFLAMALVFVIAIVMRVYPALYGWYLNEFDPYFDYYASFHVVTLAQQHGLIYALFNNPPNCPPTNLGNAVSSSYFQQCHSQQGYFYWHDIRTWYPFGRDVATTSQVGLQLTGAMLYLFVNGILHVPVSYYDFLVFLPVLFGSVTCVALYYLVKKITNNSAGGIFAALIFAVSPPILERGNLGWFKSEPLSLLLSVVGSYLFISMYDARVSTRGLIIRAALAGLLFGDAIISWGGGDQYVLVFGLIFIIAPFIRGVDLQKTVYGGAIVSGLMLLVAAATPRPGPGIVTNYIGVALLGCWVFSLLAYFLKRYGDPLTYLGNLIKVLLVLIFGGLVVIGFGLLGSISGRYLTVIYSAYRTTDPLIQSVAEQFVPTGSQFFSDYAIVLLLAGFGVYVAFRRKNLAMVFALVLGITGVYVASSFSRLMVYSTLALAILGAIGLVELSESILRPTASTITRKKTRVYEARSEIKIFFAISMIFLIALPVFFPPNQNVQSSGYQLEHSGWFTSANVPVSIANGGTAFSTTSQDWFEAFQWMRQTAANSTIVSWWDYGYWTAVMGNRTSLADNATINETQIAQIGRALISDPRTSLQVLRELHSPTYILIFLAGEYLNANSNNQQGSGPNYVYFLTVNTPFPNPAGGDESKKQWFIRIGNGTCGCFDEDRPGPTALMYPDDFTPTPYFWDNTTLGMLMPFDASSQSYLNPVLAAQGNTQSAQVTGYNQTFTNGASGINAGYTQVLSYKVKFPASDTSAPFQLAFISSSLATPSSTSSGLYSAVLIYKVNYNATSFTPV